MSSKLLDATCDPAGVVSVGSVTVPAAQVLSEGKQQSTGVLLLEADKARYITSNATDIITTIERLTDVLDRTAEALTQIATTLTSIGAGMTGGTTAPPGTLAADVTTINGKVTALNAIKTELDTLKGALK